MEKDDLGRYVVEINDSTAIAVEQVDDEITIVRRARRHDERRRPPGPCLLIREAAPATGRANGGRHSMRQSRGLMTGASLNVPHRPPVPKGFPSRNGPALRKASPFFRKPM
jgi:hypothetical protein